MNSSLKYNIYRKTMLFSAVALFLISCKNKPEQSQTVAPGEYYTCSMDPQVHEDKPGNWPICHMKMIKVKANSLKPGQIRLSLQQIELANIRWDTVSQNSISKEILITGKVEVNQTLTEAISAKTKGRIDKLFVKNVGDFIHKGEELYEIYSEELNAAQQDYILASEQLGHKDANRKMIMQFKSAAMNKLLLYGMTERQIAELKNTRKVMNDVPVYAQTDGFVSDIFLAEGNYVDEGSMLFHLASLNSLWVEAEVYLPYLPYLNIGTDAVLSIPAAGVKKYNGKVLFIAPQVQSPDRFVLARFQISNAGKEMKPGMMAAIILETGRKQAITLPLDAVLQSGNGATVWLLDSACTFEHRVVSTGMQNSHKIEITEGLKIGDVVVTSGAYLLNSEYVFKNGTNPMAGMDMGNMKKMNTTNENTVAPAAKSPAIEDTGKKENNTMQGMKM